MDAYSGLKAAWHIDRIRDLRAGKRIAPVHLQLIISDFCNQNCHFCLVAGTMIATPDGDVPIEQIKAGQKVYSANGEVAEVGETSRRRVAQVYELVVGGNRIFASAEHPILTQDGWKAISEINERDSTFVRVRVRARSSSPSGRMEQIRQNAPAKREDEQGSATTVKRENETEQSDVRRGVQEEVTTELCIQTQQRGNRTNSECCAETDVDPKSDERPGKAQEVCAEVFGTPSVENGISLSGLGDKSEYRLGTYGARNLVDREAQPGFQDSGGKESHRSGDERNFYRKSRGAHNDDLLQADNYSLPEERVAMLGGVCGRLSNESTGWSQGLLEDVHRIGGIERGLELRKVESILRVYGEVEVFNFSCDTECYEANGIVVHNCAYRMDGGFTSRHFGGNPTRFIPTEKAIEILNDAKDAGVQSVQFTGGGEPTVHKDHERIFQQAWDLGFKTGLVTNGTNLKAWPFDWIRVSLDAGTEKTYAKVRESKLWPKVMRNLKLGHAGLYGIGFVVTRENCTEILEAAEIAFAAGADYIRVTAMFSEKGSEYYRGKMKTIQRGIAAAKELENANFKVVDLFHHRLDDLDSGTPTVSRCGYQQFTTYIGGDQHVYRCCSTAYTPLGDVGDLSNMRFSEWLSHDPYTDFDPGQCRVCQFNQQNEVIEYMVGTPMHVEFP